MTEQEILDKHLETEDGICHSREFDYIDDYGIHKLIEEAMREFAKQEAIAFKEWCGDKWIIYDGYDMWIDMDTHNLKSTEKLYESYLQSKQK